MPIVCLGHRSAFLPKVATRHQPDSKSGRQAARSSATRGQAAPLQMADVQECLLADLKVPLLQPVSVMRLSLRHQALPRAAADIPLLA